MEEISNLLHILYSTIIDNSKMIYVFTIVGIFSIWFIYILIIVTKATIRLLIYEIKSINRQKLKLLLLILKKIFLSIKEFCCGSKVRKVVTITTLLFATYLAMHLKTVPNYSKDRGYEIVWESNYEKYQQGYCLDEDRILSTEEIFRKGIGQWYEKTNMADSMVQKYQCEEWGQLCESDGNYARPLEGILLTDFKSNEFIDKFPIVKRFNRRSIERDYNTTSVDPREILQFDIENMTAGFEYPFIYRYEKHVNLDLAFVLENEDGYLFRPLYLYSTTSSHKRIYKRDMEEEYKGYPYRLDNCGNVDYDIEEFFKIKIDFMKNGG